MAITYRDDLNGKHILSNTGEYQVTTVEGNQYEVVFHKYGSIKNTTMYINRMNAVGRVFGFASRKQNVAKFSYDNSGNYDGRDARKLSEALKNKLSAGMSAHTFSNMDRIALTVAQALEINEYATIDIMQSFDQASWDMKAEALIALYEMRQQHEKKNKLEAISPEDGVMETKLRALAAYQEIMNELPTGTSV